MINLLLDWPIATGLPFFLLVSIIVGSAVYLLAHRLIKNALAKGHERVGRVLFRTSASLLALLVSFTFANQRVVYYQLKDSLEAEASQLVDIHLNLDFYDTPEAQRINKLIREYVAIVIEDGWVPLSEDPFNSGTVNQFFKIYNQIHEIQPETYKQKQLLQNILSDLDEVLDYMQVRIYQTRPEAPYLIYIALFGFVVVMILFSVYKPDRISLLFLSLYNAFIAMIIYFTLMMSNPLIGPLQIKAEPFVILQEAIDAEDKRGFNRTQEF